MPTSSSSSVSSSSSSESGAGEEELNDWEGMIRERGEEAEVYRATRTKTVSGALTISYPTVDATVWCLLLPASSADRARYQRRQLNITHTAWVAEEPDAEIEGCRLKYGSICYYIHGVRDLLERGELWALDVEEVL